MLFRSPSTLKSEETDDHNHKQSKEPTSTNTNGSTVFGEDFIPFAISDEKPGPSRRKATERMNERYRETEKDSDRDVTSRHLLPERQAMLNGDSNEVPTLDRVKGNSKISGSERERDRGKAAASDDKHDRRKNGHGRDRKRKYDEYDDGRSNQKRRAEVGSRKCPWVADLDLNYCSNVAEM